MRTINIFAISLLLILVHCKKTEVFQNKFSLQGTSWKFLGTRTLNVDTLWRPTCREVWGGEGDQGFIFQYFHKISFSSETFFIGVDSCQESYDFCTYRGEFKYAYSRSNIWVEDTTSIRKGFGFNGGVLWITRPGYREGGFISTGGFYTDSVYINTKRDTMVIGFRDKYTSSPNFGKYVSCIYYERVK